MIGGSIVEVPVGLPNRQAELHFHQENLGQIEIYFNGKPKKRAQKVH
jgi:hypothetical protein